MNLRTRKQQEFTDLWMKKGQKGILHLCPRFGKCYVGINVISKLKPDNVLITYPSIKIKNEWIENFNKRNVSYENVTFSTFLSLHKHSNKVYDLIIIDEIHLLSKAQIMQCYEMLKINKKILGLTGTLSKRSKYVLRKVLQLNVYAEYLVEEAIYDKILPDYSIHVITTPLDNSIPITNIARYKNRTEKEYFNTLITALRREEGREYQNEDLIFRIKLKIISILQRSIAKRDVTVQLINKYNKERILVFCGLTDIADSLGIPSYHSKSLDKKTWNEFLVGDIPHMSVIKIGNTGTTYMPLSKVIINYFDSNCETLSQKILRCMSLEYDNPNKKAIIYIVSSDEEIEINWLKKALSMMNKNKIKFCNSN